MDKIIIKGARENNLKNINIELPKNKLIVMTGLSGSGKSSLAFDTIYAEGQRRYVESLSAYARQFLGGTEKPDVDSIEGLSPAISIDQKTTSKNPRSTVGTVTMLIVPVSYCVLKLGFSPISVFVVSLIVAIICLFLRLWIVKRLVNFPFWSYTNKVFVNALIVTIGASVLPVLLHCYLEESISNMLLSILICFICSIISIYWIGLKYEERLYIKKLIRSKFTTYHECIK